MAPRKTVKKAATVTKSKKATKKKSSVVKDETVPKEVISQPKIPTISPATSTIDRVFQVINIDKADIGEGLFMLRKLGGQKYEAINVSQVDIEDISSEQVAERINAIPKCRQLLEATHSGLNDITTKLDQAVHKASCISMHTKKCVHMFCLTTANIDVADGSIFRFTKLPIELRYKVYEFAVIGEKPLVHALYNKRATTLGLGILATCHAIYQECIPFFWKNTFVVNDLPKSFQFMREYFMRNVRKASFEWFGYRMKDPITIQMLHNCKKLESLHIVLTGHCGSGGLYDRPQYLFQDDTSIKSFSRTNGFDSLVSLHGLKQVTVSRAATASTYYHTASKAEFDIFEVFLIKKLTEPVKAPSKKRKTALSIWFQEIEETIYIQAGQLWATFR
ncbi:hypothetical protein CJF30_00008441 [Rutstroemia sp. NJR-2017a BBW]|nr:hypothetical protein CJF30_00008441 [Rutstroemia sp. NJR-2017a BBW]